MPDDPQPSKQPQSRPPRRNWAAKTRPHPIEIVLTCLLIAVGGAQVFIYFRQASIMEEQTIISARQLAMVEADQRPWLKVDVTIDSIIFLDNKDVVMDLNIKVKNVGKSPADDIREGFGLVATDVGVLLHAGREEEKQCAALTGPGRFLFPGDEDPFASYGVRLDATKYLQTLQKPGKISFTVIGCADYALSRNRERRGYTGVAYNVTSHEDGSQEFEFEVIPGEVAHDKIRVYRNPFAADSSNDECSMSMEFPTEKNGT
jgi:hypothetical protein